MIYTKLVYQLKLILQVTKLYPQHLDANTIDIEEDEGEDTPDKKNPEEVIVSVETTRLSETK